jgi:hypothetical protein
MSEPETLETFISAKFTALALSIPEDDVSQESSNTGQRLIG